MEPTIAQKKKHLLLLNRIIRKEAKADIIPTPSKLSEAEVDSFFNKLFVKKDDYYVPIKNKMEIKIDEELFKGLIKKPKMAKEAKPMMIEDKPMMTKEQKAEEKKQKEESLTKKAADFFISKFINPYLRKIEAGKDASKELKMMTDKFVKMSKPTKKNVEKRWSKLYASILGPADEGRMMRKENLKEEDMKLNDEIKKMAKEK
jgi:hypothetical protein